ncbi:unnamed protein product [Acidithrix sp. C25]|nr:unnamed protein product [Acidithrix sp. C25]
MDFWETMEAVDLLRIDRGVQVTLDTLDANWGLSKLGHDRVL